MKKDLKKFKQIAEKYDIIVSNPPYIKTEIIETLDNDVKCEPYIALDGGEDGLDFYRKIIGNAYKYLNPAGHLMMEIGYDQGEAVKELLIENGYKDVKIIKDGEVLYEGNVDDAPQELKDLDYKTISGAYPTIIEV